ncbi:hypothetical protein Daura_17265 [Dactylosporangium aurantiacum]|uniref:Uncharacterized protein n=1 Tax=Dactylosporangium aurantiacum TaxID=35754 RepID=A0A9Q9MIC1_9ACTN|nr:hypothetical protein [Dactylosporangium aurantiacum]MDG6103257.1 hypothetical protein [Dactylosporangium aurantiacum]UWZ57759.1 hypothetical protein Daura_17265 [Dactylosporangium aurantiacum]
MTVDVARPPRPAQVTVAFWLQLAAVVLLLGLTGLAIAHAVHYDREISRVAALVGSADPDEVRDERTGNVVATLFVGVPALVLAAWLSATARPVLRGSNVARVFVFVAGGGQLLLTLCQFCGGFLLLPLAFAVPDGGDDVVVDDGVSWEEHSDFLDTLYADPDLFSEIFFGGALLVALTVLVLTLAVVLLVALPPAHRYFVPKAPQPWPPHPALGPMPYYICPDPSAHLPAAPAHPEPPAHPVPPAPAAQQATTDAPAGDAPAADA